MNTNDTLLASLAPAHALPDDTASALLVGRAWVDGLGPVLCRVEADETFDISEVAPTMRDLLERDDAASATRALKGRSLGSTESILANSAASARDPRRAWLLAPCDLQAIKAAGVTFAASMLERVIEEQAGGDASKAQKVREAVVAVIGDNLSNVVPGSAEAARLKEVLIAEGLWSQYLEVGIGPDAEIFTKSQPMSAVGTGSDVGIHPRSAWNNPEPEVVLAVNSRGQAQGATLGNDVNLRDFEGRSALLLGKAKDNNASCAIGPVLRLFDRDFGLDDLKRCVLGLRVRGLDGFVLEGSSSLAMISRDPPDLVAQTCGSSHQYPDGFMLFLGTMFAPTQDRHAPGQGFTHQPGDVVDIRTPLLGALANTVKTSDLVAPWTYGARSLMRDLARRGLLD